MQRTTTTEKLRDNKSSFKKNVFEGKYYLTRPTASELHPKELISRRQPAGINKEIEFETRRTVVTETILRSKYDLNLNSPSRTCLTPRLSEGTQESHLV